MRQSLQLLRNPIVCHRSQSRCSYGVALLTGQCHAHSTTSRNPVHFVQKGWNMHLHFPVASTSSRRKGGIFRAMRGQGMQITSWEYAFPTIADKCPVDTLKRLMRMLIAPSVEHAIEVNHHQHNIIEEATELSHQSMIKPIITLVPSSVNHIKVTTQGPRARPSLPDRRHPPTAPREGC
jgi:hypothetical protein